MLILITGATVFIGVNLAEVPLSRGDSVILVGRRSVHPYAEIGPRRTPRAAFEVLSKLPGTLHTVNV